MKKELVASAKPNLSVVTEISNGMVKYHVCNRFNVHEVSPERLLNDLINRRYRRAMTVSKRKINAILGSVFDPIPVYRDCDVTDIILLIKSLKASAKKKAHVIVNTFEKKLKWQEEKR